MRRGGRCSTACSSIRGPKKERTRGGEKEQIERSRGGGYGLAALQLDIGVLVVDQRGVVFLDLTAVHLRQLRNSHAERVERHGGHGTASSNLSSFASALPLLVAACPLSVTVSHSEHRTHLGMLPCVGPSQILEVSPVRLAHLQGLRAGFLVAPPARSEPNITSRTSSRHPYHSSSPDTFRNHPCQSARPLCCCGRQSPSGQAPQPSHSV